MTGITAFIDELGAEARDFRLRNGRPLVTLCYAQSLDGSLTHYRGIPLTLSGEESFRFVHKLRSVHDAILVGIGTVLADDPQLNVRMVEGKHPQPVILDTHLRFPLSARLLSRPGPSPLIVTSPLAKTPHWNSLQAAGAKLIEAPTNAEGRIDLQVLLGLLAGMGIDSILAEGGASVITSLLEARLVDRVVITIAPVFVGGVRAVERHLLNGAFHTNAGIMDYPQLQEMHIERMGKDMVIAGRLSWSDQ